MNCIYCGNPAGFMRFTHKECEIQYQDLLYSKDEILNSYISGAIDKKIAQESLLDIANHPYFQNSLLNISDRIKGNEIIMRNDFSIYVTEYKNHCSMIRTGLSYARYPIYEEGYIKLGLCIIIITDKKINIVPDKKGVKRVSLDINKIINIQTKNSIITVEVKTTSPVPHRISLEYKENDISSVFSLIKCFSKI